MAPGQISPGSAGVHAFEDHHRDELSCTVTLPDVFQCNHGVIAVMDEPRCTVHYLTATSRSSGSELSESRSTPLILRLPASSPTGNSCDSPKRLIVSILFTDDTIAARSAATFDKV